MANPELAKLSGTEWAGTGELWLDPAGDQAQRYECTMRVEDGAVRYTWWHDGKEHHGAIVPREGGATWSDSWHQPAEVECREVPGAWGLLAVHYAYSAPGSPDWGWRTTLSQRPSGELVLQMTNIAPWGEEARAVRMVFSRKG